MKKKPAPYIRYRPILTINPAVIDPLGQAIALTEMGFMSVDAFMVNITHLMNVSQKINTKLEELYRQAKADAESGKYPKQT